MKQFNLFVIGLVTALVSVVYVFINQDTPVENISDNMIAYPMPNKSVEQDEEIFPMSVETLSSSLTHEVASLSEPKVEQSHSFALYQGEEREIGLRAEKGLHHPSEEIFNIYMDSLPEEGSAVYLEYELYGVADYTQVTRSINEQPVFGGYFIKRWDTWTQQSERINPSLLHKGLNVIRFTIPEDANYRYKIRNLKINAEAVANPTDKVLQQGNNHSIEIRNENQTNRTLVVNQPTTAFYYQQYGFLQGYVSGKDANKAKVKIGKHKVRNYQGEFEGIAVRPVNTQTETFGNEVPSEQSWTTTVEAVFPDGEVLRAEVTFERPSIWDYETGFNPDIHYAEKEISTEEAFCLFLDDVSLEGKVGSIEDAMTLSITALRSIDIPRLNPGMVNVTSGGDAYRFLPHGTHFKEAVDLRIGYDTAKIPKGHHAKEIRSYYYDEVQRYWVALPRDSVSVVGGMVCSKTTHFTDIINAIVKVPEMPETKEFTPTSIKELQAADPSSGIQMIQAPTANSQGTANVSYPIQVPAGRQGLQPNLSINYSSEGGNGLLGMGWDMQIPAITVDTKWGVPRYNADLETEGYLLNGEELLPSARLDGFLPRCTTGTKQFYPRIEGAYDSIVRYGMGPDSYFWVVTNKQGVKFYYGSYDGFLLNPNVLLKDKNGNIAYWPLCKVEDPSGNFMIYCYTIRDQWDTVSQPNQPPATGVYLGQQLWLEAITYTGNDTTDGAYRVIFASQNCSIDEAKMRGCNLDLGYNINGYTRENTVESLSKTTTIDTEKTVFKEDVIKNNINKTEPMTGKGDPSPKCTSAVDIKICMRDLLCSYNKIVLSKIEVGTTPPNFDFNSPDPFPLISNNPSYGTPSPCFTQIHPADTTCVFPLLPYVKYYVVATAPNTCRVQDPVSFILTVITDEKCNVTDLLIDSVSGIPTMGANITVDVSRYLINVPVECVNCYTSTPCDTCYTGCDTCPTLYTCVEKVYIGVYDTLCTHKLVNNCNFRLQMLGDPYHIVSDFYTDGQGASPMFLRCDSTYFVEGYYFGEEYQNIPISFKFILENNGKYTIWDVAGLQYPNNNILAKYYPNSKYFVFFMPVSPINLTAQVRLEIKNQAGVGIPNYHFIIADKTTGLVVGEIKETDAQGFTQNIDLLKGRIYHIHEIDPSTYYNPNNSIPYQQLISEDVDISFDLWVDFCNTDLITDPDYSSQTTGNIINGYTITFMLDDRLFIKKVDNFGKPINGTIFNVKNIQTSQTKNYTTSDRGRTEKILVDNLTDYVIQETYVPAGYVLDTQSVYISTDGNGMVSSVASTRSVQSEIYNGSQYLIVENEKETENEYLYFKIKKIDAITGQVIPNAGIKKYLQEQYYGYPFITYTDSSGYSCIMKMDRGMTYYIKEYYVPPGYNTFSASFMKISVAADGNINILDSNSILPNWYLDDDGVWVFTFLNYPEDSTIDKRMNPKTGCDTEYAYDRRFNSRYGFRQSSKEKISKIIVFYKDSCVRTYTFCYGEDFFKRAQLREINQWNSTDTGAPFTHFLEYYEDVNTNTRQILKERTDWNFSDVDLSLENLASLTPNKLKNFFKENLLQPSILGTNRTWVTGINGGADVGFLPISPLKNLSGGLYFNASFSTGKGKTMLIDIDGDGLPDKLYNKIVNGKNKVYYCLQNNNNGFDDAKELSGVKRFLCDFSDNFGFGLQVSFFVHGGIQGGFGNSWTTVFFTDINGDGLLEQVHPKGVKQIGSLQRPPTINLPNCDGEPQINQEKDSLKVICDTNFHFKKDVYERDRSNEIRYDVVRVWKALNSEIGYDLFAPVWLEEDSIANENFCGEEDSVIVSIEYYGTGLNFSLQHIILWADTLGGSDTRVHCEGKSWNRHGDSTLAVDTCGVRSQWYMFDTLRMARGDMLFFRVRPWKNGVKKKVVWDPQVRPIKSNGITKTMYDENNRMFVGGNKASESQLLQGDSVFYCPAKGKISVDYNITTPLLSDTVRFEFWHNNTLKHSYTVSGASTTIPLQSFSIVVDTMDILKFKVMCGSNVNMHAIEWTPRLYYHYIIFGSDTIQTFLNNGNDSIKLLEYTISPWHEFYSQMVTNNYEILYYNDTSSNDTLKKFQIHTRGNFLGYQKMRITIKQNGELKFAKDTIILFPPNVYHITLPINKIINLEDSQLIYISCYFDNPLVISEIYSADVEINKSGLRNCIVYTKEPHHVVFGDLYERWGQFLYLTDKTPNTNMLNMMDLNKVNKFNYLDSANIYSYIDTTSLGDSITNLMSYKENNFETRMNQMRNDLTCLPMFNDGDNNGYMGFYRNAFIRGADINLGGIPCPDFNEGEEEDNCGDTTYAESGTQSGGSGTPKPDGTDIASFGMTKKSSSYSTSYTLGAPSLDIPLGLNYTNGKSKQLNDMMDLNGDGFPDLIRSGDVYYSRPKVNSWENSIAIFDEGTHHKSTTNTYGGNYTATTNNTIKESTNSNKGPLYVTSKNDKAKETYPPEAVKPPSVYNSGSASLNFTTDNTDFSLIDINGDGLPDRIYASDFQNVAINIGYSFEDKEHWSSVNKIGLNLSVGTSLSVSGGISGIPFPMGEDFSACSKSYSGGLNSCLALNQNKQMLIDINGDGLPDKVVFNNSHLIRVYYNIGCGFSDESDTITLNDFYFYERNTSLSVSGNFGLTFGFPIGVWAKISASGGADLTYSLNQSKIDFIDMDGDGVVDIVFMPNNTTMAIRYSALGRTGLLKTIVNPMGGSIELNYHKTQASVFYGRRWVMDTVIVKDNLNGDGIGSMKTAYNYQYGYYDRNERTFYGFAKVIETQYNENNVYRKIERYYRNDSIYTKGIQIGEIILDNNNNKYVYTRNTYQFITPLYASQSPHALSKFPALTEVLTCYYEGQPTAQITQTKTFTYGAYGNITQQTQTSTSMLTLTANITYHPQQNGNYCVGIPKSVEVPGYRKRTTQIDNKGRFTDIRDYYTMNNYLTTHMEYDNYGNCIRIVYPNHSYSYVYDSEVHTYPISVRDTFGHRSYAQDYDFRFGVPLTIIDKYGSRMEYTLDAWGRILTIRGPKEIDSLLPYTIRYQYNRVVCDSVTKNIIEPASTFTFNYDPEYPTNDIEVYTYSDGLGRIVQVKKDAEVNGTEQMVISGKVIYDALGRAVENYYPTVQALGDTTYYTGVDGVNPSTTQYDILDRPVRQEAPDGTFQTFDYDFGQDASGHTLFKTTAVDQNGHPSISLKDVNDLQWGIKPAGEEYVYFDYNLIGECITVYSSLADNFYRTYGYDMLGRKINYGENQLNESYTYTGANLTQKNIHWFDDYSNTDQNKTITYTYLHNRLLNMQSSEYNLPTEYVYDDQNLHGRLVAIKDESGIQTFEYGNMGEVVKSARAYALPSQSAQPVAFSTWFTYDSWGRMLQIVYPDGEVLDYTYDRGGQLKSMQGVKDSCTYNYLIDQKYDKFGAKTEMAYGNYMVTKYIYNPLNLRLDSLVASLQSNNYFSMGYRYDAKGNVTQLHSKYSCFNGNNPITQTFVYDSTDQLTDAQGTFYTTTVTYGNTGKIATYSSPTTPNTTFYYPDIKPTSTVFAPDSSFDGDRFTYYDFGINGSLRRKWHYEGDEFNREERGEYYWFNAFNCMKAYSNNAEQYAYYGYDASGERTYKINVNPDILYINAENVSMTYHIDRYMLYPNGYMNVNQAGEYTKHYYADALRIASKIGGNYDNNFCDSVAQIETDYPEYITHRKNEQEFAMKNELDSVTKYNIITSTLLFDAPNECLLHGGFEEEVFYYHPDHLGSTGMVTNKYANITQALLYASFGEIVNEYNPGWSSNRVPKYSFNAKELDEENGMYYYSARYYAPPTFISRDPMFEKYPSISPYTYCANNPMKYVDPDGRKFVVPRVRIEGQKGRYNVTFDGTTATMQQAGRKSSGEVMQYQSGTNQFVDNMIASYNYITNCDGADVDGAMQTMATSSVEIKVKHQRFGGSYLNKTIRFDFSQGERIERDDGVSGYESPAVGFWSEVYHGYLDITGENRSLKSLSDTYNLKEENYVHVTKGNQVIDALNKCYNSNETKRNNYEDAKHEVNMKIVTDTEPIQ